MQNKKPDMDCYFHTKLCREINYFSRLYKLWNRQQVLCLLLHKNREIGNRLRIKAIENVSNIKRHVWVKNSLFKFGK